MLGVEVLRGTENTPLSLTSAMRPRATSNQGDSLARAEKGTDEGRAEGHLGDDVGGEAEVGAAELAAVGVPLEVHQEEPPHRLLRARPGRLQPPALESPAARSALLSRSIARATEPAPPCLGRKDGRTQD